MVHCPYPPLVQSQGAGPFCSDVLDSMGLDGQSILNSTKRDRIFSSMRLLKASHFALIASFDAIVYASRSIILRSPSSHRGNATLMNGCIMSEGYPSFFEGLPKLSP
ncbi:hypothetical protein BHE74_00056948 [Ensete ventricosum]|nr:hypothetical protein GW17_00036805 [Ensete ventricosum]RWW37874.1 hypothetical protein BHE74_00056948 [Ensete ventricosum]